jgi:hypothetical protein
MCAFIAGVHFAERPHHHYSEEECKKCKNAPEGGSGLALIVDEKGMPQEVYVIRPFLVSEFRIAYPDRTAFLGDYFRIGGYPDITLFRGCLRVGRFIGRLLTSTHPATQYSLLQAHRSRKYVSRPPRPLTTSPALNVYLFG